MIEIDCALEDVLSRHDLRVVLFDMDDTLYEEYEYVISGFSAVAQDLERRYGVFGAFEKLKALYSVDKQRVFDHWFESNDIPYSKEDIRNAVRVYKEHTPQIKLTNTVQNLLLRLKAKGYRLGLITDGDPGQQHKKIEALHLKRYFEHIVVTDEFWGPAHRKPSPRAFEWMQHMFLVPYEQMVYVGDNPAKDFAIRASYPILTIQVCGGVRAVYGEDDYLKGIRPDYKLKGELR